MNVMQSSTHVSQIDKSQLGYRQAGLKASKIKKLHDSLSTLQLWGGGRNY